MAWGMTVRPTVRPAMASPMRSSLLYLGAHVRIGRVLNSVSFVNISLALVCEMKSACYSMSDMVCKEANRVHKFHVLLDSSRRHIDAY